MRIIITGVAGFIGMHTALRLLSRGDEILGIDNLNEYYDVNLKHARLQNLARHSNFRFIKSNIHDRNEILGLFEQEKPTHVIHLAGQAGVRHSLTDPFAYIDSNIQGFLNILEGSRRQEVRHLIYASSSSVYGSNGTLPFSEHHSVNHPLSIYAATKKSNELMSHVYSHLFGLPTTGLRFFTVYGPWGRPDMALFQFTRSILECRPINVFNHGQMTRDFTYIDDAVESVVRVLDKPATPNPFFDQIRPDPATSNSPYRIFNVGNSRPTSLMDYIRALETALDQRAAINYLPMQPGDVLSTNADTSELYEWIHYSPDTPIDFGVASFVQWYKSYYSTELQNNYLHPNR